MQGVRKLVMAGVIGAAALSSAPASASLIDFTDATPWAGANGQTSFTSGEVTLSRNLGRLTFNDPTCGNNTVGLACEGDGIGISSWFDLFGGTGDEINGLEILMLTFASAVNIVDVHLLDVFGGEKAQLSIDRGETWTVFDGAGKPGGYTETGFSANNVTSLWLASVSNSASLARIATVPEPGTLALLGVSLLGIGIARRR